jgi:glycerol-3-phosphate acyltransferase PlsY
VLNFFWPVLAGYLIGSFPTAFLAVRWRSGVDIRDAGSGNVGTLNSYQVTRSRTVGLTVLLVDVLKGAGAVLAGRALVPELPFIGGAIAGTASVLGHSYPVWLRFRGGRGLATAAGAMGSVSLALVGAWMLVWGVGFAGTRAVNVASFVACVLTGAALVSVPDAVLGFAVPDGATSRGLRAFGVLVLLVMLSRLIGPAREFLRDRRVRRTTGGGESS